MNYLREFECFQFFVFFFCFTSRSKEATIPGRQNLDTTRAGATATTNHLWPPGSCSEVDTTIVSLQQVHEEQKFFKFFCRRLGESRTVIPPRRVDGAQLARSAAAGRPSANEDVSWGCIEVMAQGFPYSRRKVCRWRSLIFNALPSAFTRGVAGCTSRRQPVFLSACMPACQLLSFVFPKTPVHVRRILYCICHSYWIWDTTCVEACSYLIRMYSIFYPINYFYTGRRLKKPATPTWRVPNDK